MYMRIEQKVWWEFVALVIGNKEKIFSPTTYPFFLQWFRVLKR